MYHFFQLVNQTIMLIIVKFFVVRYSAEKKGKTDPTPEIPLIWISIDARLHSVAKRQVVVGIYVHFWQFILEHVYLGSNVH